jgi:hypothetical protein
MRPDDKDIATSDDLGHQGGHDKGNIAGEDRPARYHVTCSLETGPR